MDHIDQLRNDYALIAKIHEARRTVTMETLPTGLRLTWQIYLTILEDALSVLNALIQYSSRNTEGEKQQIDPT